MSRAAEPDRQDTPPASLPEEILFTAYGIWESCRRHHAVTCRTCFHQVVQTLVASKERPHE